MVIIGKSQIAGGGTAKRLEFTYTGDYTDRGDGVVELLSTGVINFKKETAIDVFLVGGGSSGASGDTVYQKSAAGGAGGYTKTSLNVIPRANTDYQIVIGAGGSKPTVQKSSGNNGGDTSAFGITAEGGKASMDGYRRGGNGGSGGGGPDTNVDAVTGGSDGSNGARSGAGTGQGTTTREFGETDGKLYAGGGGGGTANSAYSYGGDGGGGGGGSYKGTYTEPTSGEPNTGGGGGGGFPGTTTGVYGAAGGSGIVCIRLHKD